MLPYPGAGLDYANFHRQGMSVGSQMASMGTIGMNVGASSFTHSWLVPTQDLCAVPYKPLPNQQNHQLVENGHVFQ
jgi:neuronal PAS domain-containing protein 1/3